MDSTHSILDQELLLATHVQKHRECGDCSACCQLLAIVELQKPKNVTCCNRGPIGCAVYDGRPSPCHEFNCLWLRGGLHFTESLRPDKLGVMFDAFVSLTAGELRLTAHEVWSGAMDSTESRQCLDELVQLGEVHLSYRDGRYSTLVSDSSVGTTVHCPTQSDVPK